MPANTMLEDVSTPVVIKPVTTKSDLKRFINFQYDFYADYPYYIPPLRMEVKKLFDEKKHPFFQHGKIQGFLAENENGEVVGRIAGVMNGMHLQKYKDDTGFFGFFECIEDYGVAKKLLDTASDWLRAEGMKMIRGPVNPSLNESCGLLVEGFDKYPAFMMPYNPSYYLDFLEKYGFEREMTMWAYYIHYKYAKTDKLKRGVKLLMRRYPDIKLRSLDMSRFDEEANSIKEIYNDAWGNNWGHVPMTDEEFKKLAHDFKQIVDPSVVFILEDKGKPIAFSLTLPDLNQALMHVKDGRLFPFGLPQLLLRGKLGGIHDGRTLLMGVLQEYQGKGLDAILNLAIIEEGPKNGYDGSEMSWILDNNRAMMNALETIGGTYDKEYAMVEKSL